MERLPPPWSLIDRITVVIMTILRKTIYRFNIMLTPIIFFQEIEIYCFLLVQCIVKVLCFHFRYPLQQLLPLSFFFQVVPLAWYHLLYYFPSFYALRIPRVTINLKIKLAQQRPIAVSLQRDSFSQLKLSCYAVSFLKGKLGFPKHSEL